MSILSGDIKLVASQVMDDVPEGGGAPTPTLIADGASNSIFPDISEVDRAGGRIKLRKLFVSVQTANRDTYMGANIIIAEPPDDPNVFLTAFSTHSVFDRRIDAANQIESYLVKASLWNGFLLENHVAGQRVIQLFQRPGTPAPTIGRTLVLVINEGLSNEVAQYVRIIRVETAVNTYTASNGSEYQAKVCTCDLSDALRSNFAGSPPTSTFTAAALKTLVRDTSVADAGSYFGVVPLRVAAALGASKVFATSVYTQLVPSAATEKAEIDLRPSATRSVTLANTPRVVTVGVAPHTLRVKIGAENRSFSYVQILSPLPAPGTLEVSFLVLGEWYSLLDDGAGGFTGTGTGTVNYSTGSIAVTLPALPDASSSLIFAWGEQSAYSSLSGSVTYRPPEFTFDLAHGGIDPGSLVVTWLSGGVLKTATAAVNGTLSGHASGRIDHTSGELTLRPSAMIDAGGEFSLSYTWSTVVKETKTGLSVSGGGLVTFTTEQVPAEGSIFVEWFTTKTSSATSGSTATAGASTKKTSSNTATQAKVVATESPQWIFNTNTYQMVGTERTVTATVTTDTASGSASKFSQTSNQTSELVISVYNTVTENGAGGFLNSMGTINYAGKSITLKVIDPSASTTSYSNDTETSADFAVALTNASADPGATGSGYSSYAPSNGGSISSTSGGSAARTGGTFGSTAIKEAFDNSALFVSYRTSISAGTAHTQSIAPPAVQIDLAPYTTERVVPGSVRFTWMGHVFEDIEGTLYRDPTSNSPGTNAGVIDYNTGMALITDYVVSGSPSSFALNSLWTSKGQWRTSQVFCRTPSAPIKPGGFVFSIVDVAGTQITATSDSYGEITGDHCIGHIDYQTGVVDMIFGDLVLDSGLSAEQKAEWWYAKALTQITAAGKVWKPWPVDPTSLRYNVVSYFYLPLDADLLGIDPVRLPQDGRVPIFRPGGFAVVGHTGGLGPQTVSNGQTLNCGRVRLSRVRIIDSTGAVINTGYSEDLEAGTVTFSNVTGYAQPVTIEHRIEDMVMISDVQITGQLGFTRPLTHDYPLTIPPTSYISSALMAGDLKSRVSVIFDQATWDTVTWSDTLVGNPATGTYNDVLAPIAVTNFGATSERWIVRFLTTTTFQVIGEHVGVITTGDINTDCSPLNPATSQPYLTIPALGWGSGWATGNILRLNTVGALFPYWLALTVQQGPEAGADYKFSLLARGDVDKP